MSYTDTERLRMLPVGTYFTWSDPDMGMRIGTTVFVKAEPNAYAVVNEAGRVWGNLFAAHEFQNWNGIYVFADDEDEALRVRGVSRRLDWYV